MKTKKNLLNSSAIPLLVIFLTFSVFFISSCNKENATLEEEIGEFDNPYKEYGVLHNDVLGEILEITSETEISPKKILDGAKKIAYSRGLMNSKNDTVFPEKQIMDFYECMDDNFEDMSSALVPKGYVSERMNQKLIAFSQLVDEDDVETLSLEEMHSRLITYEWSIVNDNLLSPSEKEAMLVFTSVAKGSLDFWYQYYVENGVPSKAGWRFWFVLGADAVAWAGCVFSPGGIGIGWGSIVSAAVSGLAHYVVH